MSQVIADPEALRQLAAMLQQFCGEAREGLQRLRGRLQELEASGTWQDEQQRRFSGLFEESAGQLHAALEPIESEQVALLLQLAQTLEPYGA